MGLAHIKNLMIIKLGKREIYRKEGKRENINPDCTYGVKEIKISVILLYLSD